MPTHTNGNVTKIKTDAAGVSTVTVSFPPPVGEKIYTPVSDAFLRRFERSEDNPEIKVDVEGEPPAIVSVATHR